MRTKLFRNIGSFIGLSLFIVVLIILYHTLREYSYYEIVGWLRNIPPAYILMSIGLTILDYLILTAYDYMGLLYVQYRLPYIQVAQASFIGYTFSHTATFLGGGAARYRIYSAMGLSADKIAELIAFCGLTFWLGFFTLTGTVFLIEPVTVPQTLHIGLTSVRPLGIIFTSIVAMYLALTAIRKKNVTIRNWKFAVPSFHLGMGQILISSLDWILAGAVLYVLIPATIGISFPKFLGLFLLAQVAGLASYIPGGLGVFELIMVLGLKPFGHSPAVVGSLLLYRLIYYLLPFVAASVMLAVHEALRKKEDLIRWKNILAKWSSAVAPRFFAVMTLIAGALLVFSGVIPATPNRLEKLREFMPLPIVETSHFLGSLCGAALLILARGIERRLDAAYHLTLIILGAAIAFVLFKGLDYEEVIILTILFACLLPCRKLFYRKSSLIHQSFSVPWISFVGIIMLSSVWLGLFVYRHVTYDHELWWQFEMNANAPRFLRATTGAIIIILFYSLIRLLSPARPKPTYPNKEILAKVSAIVLQSRKTYANLALLGDKALLFSESQNTFIMYGTEGRSWIALGDPIGSIQEYREIIWQFTELVDHYGGWPVFYRIDKQSLDLYLDLGMTFLKFGEEGCVFLREFSLEGPSHKELRSAHRKIEQDNYVFTIIPPHKIPAMLHEFKAISDAWLASKNTSERKFSLGFFESEYLMRFPAAIVRKEDKIVAFANILTGAEKEELSIDLMRYLPDSPNGIMDYLFTELMLWGRHEGYEWFNLGTTPLSGLIQEPLAPLWSKVGTFVFRHGEHFYNFQGLRQYKEKFGPQWQPKYIACPKGLMLPQILIDLTKIVSSRIKGTIMK